MDKPLISVIIPNYNHRSFLQQRIESVIKQTFQDFELILLDDASTDGSQEFLDQYSNHDKVTHLICNDVNSGSVFRQWIKGVSIANGKYIWIAESDDFADERFLETTIKALETNDKLGFVFTDSFKVDNVGQKLGLVSKSKNIDGCLGNNNTINKFNCINYLLDKLFVVNASSVLFRKSALLSLDFDVLKTFKNTGDIFVYLGIVLNHDAIYLHNPLNFMRLHERNTTKKGKKNGRIYLDNIRILDHYLNELTNLKSSRDELVNFIVGLFFLSIDFGYLKQLKILIKKMTIMGYIERKTTNTIKIILFIYVNCMYKGRPLFLREHLKSVLKASF